MSITRSLPGIVAGIFFLCTAAPPSMAAGRPAKAQPISAPAAGAAQVDGMCAAVVDRLWDRTDVYWHQGDYPRIISLDRIITEADPHFLEPYSTGGWLMESDGQLADAEAYYRLGANRNPTKSYAWYQLSAFYFNTLHAYPKAISVLKKSVTLADAGVVDWKMLAHSYEKVGDYPAALAAWQTIKRRYPTALAVDANLHRVQMQVAAQNDAAAGVVTR